MKHFQFKLTLLLLSLMIPGIITLFSRCEKIKSNTTDDTTQVKDSIEDADGNYYKIVTIGDATWMSENLRVTRYADGTPISYINSCKSWHVKAADKAFCYYNDDISNAEKFGALYTWTAAMNGSGSSNSYPGTIQGACPTGWHIPTDREWSVLETDLGGKSKVAKEMQDLSGFAAILAGAIYPEIDQEGGHFIGSGEVAMWWSCTSYTLLDFQIDRELYSDSLSSNFKSKTYGLSIRCVKDKGDVTNETIPSVTTVSVGDVMDVTALLYGNITSEGGSAITKCGFVWDTDSLNLFFGNANSSNDLFQVINNTFNHTAVKLTPDTKYFFKAYAENKTGIGYGKTVTFIPKSLTSNIKFNQAIGYDSIFDHEGNKYRTVKIGNQTWLAENLKSITYTTGEPIANIFNYSLVSWYNNDQLTSKASYGALYSPNAIFNNPEKICPAGWHIPNVDEWDSLIVHLGGSGVAGGKMKESGTTHWADPNTGGTNDSGFTALPDLTGNSGSYVTSTMWISRMAGVDFLVGPFYKFTAKSPELTKSFSIAGGLWSMPIRCIKN
jgi:uncharacterized protein (TIGR02145 family)